eukprot:scaffold59319_cov41-Prasinocladus_malaysianus.AAC.2
MRQTQHSKSLELPCFASGRPPGGASNPKNVGPYPGPCRLGALCQHVTSAKILLSLTAAAMERSALSAVPWYCSVESLSSAGGSHRAATIPGPGENPKPEVQ